MNKKEFLEAIEDKNWEYFNSSLDVNEILKIFSFEECLLIAYEFLGSKQWEPFLEEKTYELTKLLRKKYIEVWNKDWKNEVFYSSLCWNVYKYDEAFQSLKRLVETMPSPPSSLLIMYIFTSSNEPKALLSKKEEKELATKAYRIAKNADTARSMAAACDRNNESLKRRWYRMIAKRLEKKKKFSPIIVPDAIKEKITPRDGYKFEE